MSRILVLTSRFPYPVVGGDKLRIHYLCRELAKRHRLTLLSICGSHSEMEAEFDASVFSEVHRVFLPKWRSWIQSALAIPTSLPMQIAYYRSSKYAHAVDRLSSRHDLVLAHLIRTGHYIRDRTDLPRILEMTDAISLNYQRVRAIGVRGFKGMVMRWEASRLQDYERNMLTQFELTVLVSHVDRNFLLQGLAPGMDARKVVVAPNGVDLGRLSPVYSTQSQLVVFIGNLRSVQNQDACEHFVQDVFPLVKARLPGAKFRIIGPGPGVFLSKMNSVPDVEAVGLVDSISEAVRGAFCGVCPIRVGAGIQNKVLEYFALGLPAVVSPVGLEGLDATPEEHLILADGPTAMADALVRLHSDPILRDRLANNGLGLVRERFTWESNLSCFVRDVDMLLAHGHCPTARNGKLLPKDSHAIESHIVRTNC